MEMEKRKEEEEEELIMSVVDTLRLLPLCYVFYSTLL